MLKLNAMLHLHNGRNGNAAMQKMHRSRHAFMRWWLRIYILCNVGLAQTRRPFIQDCGGFQDVMGFNGACRFCASSPLEKIGTSPESQYLWGRFIPKTIITKMNSSVSGQISEYINSILGKHGKILWIFTNTTYSYWRDLIQYMC